MSMALPGLDLTSLAADLDLDIELVLNGVLVQHPDFAAGYQEGLERYLAEYEDGHDAVPWTSQDVTSFLSESWSQHTEHTEVWRAGLIFGWICTHLRMRASQRQQGRSPEEQ